MNPGTPLTIVNRGSKVSHLLEGRFIVEMCFQAQEKRLRRGARSLSKKSLTSWWTGEQAPPPGAASQIFGLSRRQFRLRRNLKTLWVFSLPATPTSFC